MVGAGNTTLAGARRSRDFRALWFGESVSLVGDQVAALALPTAAIVTLGASATEVGGLNAVGTIAYPVLGLFAGALMDRVRRKPVMIAANVVRMTCFVVLVVCAATGWVSLPLLYVVAAVVGTATIFFDIAYQTYLPSLLTGDELARGNVRLKLSNSVSRPARRSAVCCCSRDSRHPPAAPCPDLGHFVHRSRTFSAWRYGSGAQGEPVPPEARGWGGRGSLIECLLR